MKLFDSTFNAIERKLDLSIKRHAVLSGNVANEQTPNFIAKEYTFENEVAKAMGKDDKTLLRTNSNHLDIQGNSGAHVTLDKSMQVGADGNNVDLDIEMGKLSANSRDYNNALNLFAAKLRMLRSAATGGRG